MHKHSVLRLYGRCAAPRREKKLTKFISVLIQRDTPLSHYASAAPPPPAAHRSLKNCKLSTRNESCDKLVQILNIKTKRRR